MKVSVIIAAYNIEKYIEKCLESVVNQTLGEIEIIVINDGSTDRTLEIIKSMAIKEDRILIIDKENQGSIEARKDGIETARGEYILFVDGDDWIEIDTLELLYNKANEKSYDIVLYNAFCSYDNRREKLSMYNMEKDIMENPLRNVLIGNIAPNMWSKFIRRDFIIKNKIKFPSDISFGEDLATVTNYFMHNPTIGTLEKNLYNYYQREDSITKKVSPKILEVDKALDFIEEQLKKKNLYELYRKEFEYTTFKHLFYCRILIADKIESIHKTICKQFKDRKIDIYNNAYIAAYINENAVSFRVRARLYNRNYYLGRIYDLGRKITKRH